MVPLSIFNSPNTNEWTQEGEKKTNTVHNKSQQHSVEGGAVKAKQTSVI